jgi:hypothetical protein
LEDQELDREIVPMAAIGATATSSVVVGNVCFQAAAKPTSTADMKAQSSHRIDARA